MALTPANRPALEQRVREDKKAEIISKQYAGKALDAIAQGAGAQVQQADSVSEGASMVPNLGYEPKFVGYAFNPHRQR